jgi:hypothetical protein
MGIDFIRSKAGNIKKAWSRGARALAAPDMFTGQPEQMTRAILAETCPGVTIQPKEQVVLECREGTIVAYRDTTRVAVHANPPEDVLTAMRSAGGCAAGQVVKVLDRAGCIEIRIKE